MGLRLVSVYILSVPTSEPFSPYYSTTHPYLSRRTRLSVAWLAIATFAAVVWLYEGCMVTSLERGIGTSAYIGLTACALPECGLLFVSRESLLLVSQSKFQMRVQGPVLAAEWTHEEGAGGDREEARGEEDNWE